MNLNQITIPAYDMPASTEFYRAMGFTQIVDTDHYARFECPEGDATFSLSLSEEIEERKKGEKSPRNASVIYFECADLDSKVTTLVAQGFEFEQLPTDQRYLWREAILHDPSDNKIKLYWAGDNRKNPPWRVELTSAANSQR
ncbi:VOC family protein [Thalassotalea euphylliae]|uniref:VOC family protein n=1 Tax=Thalassotalea euphylliae TaxID=1655234 RepID=A0A3E0TN52_9GAMM|nr:VOC family protein [Thalassotalea euphylliae]REL25777.1 VOC family protein [Thalassotalea euphylliae]